MGSSLTIFVSHAIEALLNSHHTQHFSACHLTSYKVLLLTAPHIILLCCNNLNPLFPSISEEVPLDCLMLTELLLNPHDDLQEKYLGNADFWFTDGTYFKSDNGKYCAEYVIATPFDVVEVASLPMATMDQQAEIYALTHVCSLAKDRTANMYADSRYFCEVAHDFGMLWKQHGFFTSSGNKIKNGPYVQELFDSILSPAALAIKILGILNLTL